MGQPKLLLPWGGTTIVGHIIRQWRELGSAQIAVAHRPNDTALAAELDRLGITQSDRIENPQPERGMFSSIVCAANWTGWKAGLVSQIIALGDQPHLPPDMLRALIQFHGEHPGAVCQPEFDGHARHPVLLPWKVFEGLKNTRAQTLNDFLKLIPGSTVKYPVNDVALSLDLNTPEDYKQAMTQYSP